MTKKEINEYLSANANESNYKADKLTREGYGQTIGAYHNNAKKIGMSNPTQKWHFTVSYFEYMGDVDSNPTYYSLKCPELLIWIAEVVGLSEKIIDRAIVLLKNYECDNGLVGKEKGTNCFKPIIGELKKILHITEINKILCDSVSWSEVTEKVGLIKG